uniref:PX domain-containing protein n=1 Tax=Meloidogyne javanica TaxID=6303 RepID=A0A915M4E7_MELJA
MIHISIPSTRTQTEPDDPFNKYTVYDIHVNGAFHASVRYNLLYTLHEKLVETFGHRLEAPEFPPKKIWKLDNKSLNERREALSKYLQGVISSPDVAKHAIIENAFLEFQVRSFSASISRVVKLEILLPDGRPVYIECCADDSTNCVIYFGLFLAHQRPELCDNGNESTSNSSSTRFSMLCVRWLKNFESPFISQQLSNPSKDQQFQHKILIRRVSWDPSLEEPLLDDPGLLQVPSDVKTKLTSLQEFGEFKQFVRLCHLQVGYGYEWLAPVLAELTPKGEMTLCELKVGRRQLLLEYKDVEDNETIRTCKLLSKRIRVWRVSHLDNPLQQNNQQLNNTSMMTFQLEYLIRRDEFSVFTLEMESTHAVLLSLFLQSIADEILRSREGSTSPPYKFDDCISIRAAESLEASKANSILSDQLSIKSASGSSVSNGIEGEIMQNGYGNFVIKLISYQMPFMENESFEDVGDEDL